MFFQTCEMFTKYLLSNVISSCVINIYHYCANLDQQRPSVRDLAHVHDDTATIVKFVSDLFVNEFMVSFDHCVCLVQTLLLY